MSGIPLDSDESLVDLLRTSEQGPKAHIAGVGGNRDERKSTTKIENRLANGRSANRSATIGALFTRVKKRSLIFPKVEQCTGFLDEFACEVAEYDDLNRTVRYSHPQTRPDDALHATNYALLLGIRWFSEMAGGGYP